MKVGCDPRLYRLRPLLSQSVCFFFHIFISPSIFHSASSHPLQSFLNMKYDRCKTPVRVLASAFDRLLKKVAGEEDRSLLTKHYSLDSNAVPPVYLFQGRATEDEAEMICEILRSSWGKEEKERYMASGEWRPTPSKASPFRQIAKNIF